MLPIPVQVGGAKVICYAPIDSRHRHTSNTQQISGGTVIGLAAGLAICQYEGENYFCLFGCDENWNSLFDTWHETLDDAKQQAEFEYGGTINTWIDGRRSP